MSETDNAALPRKFTIQTEPLANKSRNSVNWRDSSGSPDRCLSASYTQTARIRTSKELIGMRRGYRYVEEKLA